MIGERARTIHATGSMAACLVAKSGDDRANIRRPCFGHVVAGWCGRTIVVFGTCIDDNNSRDEYEGDDRLFSCPEVLIDYALI